MDDPVPGHIGFSDIRAGVETYARIRPTSNEPPYTRINQIVPIPGDAERLLVNDMSGVIHLVWNGIPALRPFLDLNQVAGIKLQVGEFEKGLASVALHPDFARPGRPGFGRFYTASSEDLPDDPGALKVPVLAPPSGPPRYHWVIAEWRVNPANPNQADPTSRREVVRIAAQHNDHQVGLMAFNPTAAPGDVDYGLLYIGVGDGGNTYNWLKEIDRDRQGQNPGTVFGAILRIDPLPSGRASYDVPRDNPFTRLVGWRPEVWAIGLRNPQRFSWDAERRGQLIVADMGQHNIEEINIVSAGGNYGWSEREGAFTVVRTDQDRLLPLPADDAGHGYLYPVARYDHDEGIAISGGFLYRGSRLPELRGQYVFGDLVTGRIFHADLDGASGDRPALIRELRLVHQGREMSLLEIMGLSGRADLRFGADNAGEIYLITKQDGVIRRLARPN